MKYIDADKLLVKIKRQQRKLALLSNTEQVDVRRNCALQNGVYNYILSVIDSLQQDEEKQNNDECPVCGWALDAAGCCSCCGYGRR